MNKSSDLELLYYQENYFGTKHLMVFVFLAFVCLSFESAGKLFAVNQPILNVFFSCSFWTVKVHIAYRSMGSPQQPKRRVAFVLIDGLGDVSLPRFGYNTPLQTANVPNLDAVASAGVNGLMDPVEVGLACGSDTAHLSLLGYDPRVYYKGRGAFESMGAGLAMSPGDIAFKSNFATFDEKTGIVTSRRADRHFEEEGPILCAALDRMKLPSYPEYEVRVRYATEHRCGVVVKGPRLSGNISGTDPLKDNRLLLQAEALDDTDEAIHTAAVVNELSREMSRILVSHPLNAKRSAEGKKMANVVLLRGCGIRIEVPSFEKKHGLCPSMVAPTKIIAGLGLSLDIDILEAPGATGDYRTLLTSKVTAIAKALSAPLQSSPSVFVPGEDEHKPGKPDGYDFGFSTSSIGARSRRKRQRFIAQEIFFPPPVGALPESLPRSNSSSSSEASSSWSGIVHPDPFVPGVRPPLGPIPPFDILPPPEVMEQKLAAQHVEMQRLATENQRLAATHGNSRQELAAAQHELQMLHAHTGAIKSEREQQMRGLMDKIAKMETELKAAEPVRLELQQARAEAENLVVARRSLCLKVSYDYEKKLFSDHLESLQAMEKNYVTMAREVEKLHLELTNRANVDIRTVAGGPYGGASGNNEKEASGRPVGQNMYEDSYGVPQGQGHAAIPGNSGAGAANASTVANAGATYAANASTVANAGAGTPTHAGAQSGSAAPKSVYDAPRAPGYEGSKGPGYDTSRGAGYDVPRGAGYDVQRGYNYEPRGSGYDIQRGPTYDAQRLPGYDAQRITGFDVQRGPAYGVQRGPHYDASRGAGYDAASRVLDGPHGQMAPASNVPYGSGTPPDHAGSGYEATAQGGNYPVRR
ncbi:hypothetical protein GH714_032103 [Hevea brasiliensis]|uniref:Metalloenzyme domain-containing protein n=1 Tax=Hevea brasiliensis TaxID=3981 RepID=A0A6A6LGQ1_HEVBR|nr:hypothetical protein GH714_032103 [Hevea brasiliensis]